MQWRVTAIGESSRCEAACGAVAMVRADPATRAPRIAS
eukprot:SAG31_NODE_31546_length_367_cov_0.563433_1_plen_37_part_10